MTLDQARTNLSRPGSMSTRNWRRPDTTLLAGELLARALVDSPSVADSLGKKRSHPDDTVSVVADYHCYTGRPINTVSSYISFPFHASRSYSPKGLTCDTVKSFSLVLPVSVDHSHSASGNDQP